MSKILGRVNVMNIEYSDARGIIHKVGMQSDTAIALIFSQLAMDFHRANAHWWKDPVTGRPLKRNRAEMIALMHSELSELLEAERKDIMDSHLPHIKGNAVELADLIIRALDYAGGWKIPLGKAIVEKREYNTTRRDHSNAARAAKHGKKF